VRVCCGLQNSERFHHFLFFWSRKRAGKTQAYAVSIRRTRTSSLLKVFFVSSVFSFLRKPLIEGVIWKDFAAPTWYFCDQASTTTHALYFSFRFSSDAHSFLLQFTRSMIWNRQSTKFDLENMFKRSFGTKEGRVGKSRPIKTTYREHAKRKMQDSLDSPPVGR